MAPNNTGVLEAFLSEDLAKGVQNLDFNDSSDFIQCSLGLSWDLKHDLFTFRVAATEKPFTGTGVLAIVNSLFDPLGLVAPIIIQGKFLLRELTSGEVLDWDSPLPDEKEVEWRMWKNSSQSLSGFRIPRAYTPTTLTTAHRKELHIFSDTLVKAIAAVVYLKVIDSDGECHIGFVLGKAKLAPVAAHTILKLELGAAVLAVEMVELVESELDISVDTLHFYTDSRVDTYITRPDGFMYMFPTEYSETGNPPNLSSGITSAQLRIQQITPLDLYLQPSLSTQHGSLGHLSCLYLK